MLQLNGLVSPTNEIACYDTEQKRSHHVMVMCYSDCGVADTHPCGVHVRVGDSHGSSVT